MGFLLRYLLLFLLGILVLRALGRLLTGLIAGASPPDRSRRSGPPERGVQMVRDPVCGTFLPPDSALSLAERGGAVRYFCSEKCRDAYRARG
jgi:YHS domain-containing protein